MFAQAPIGQVEGAKVLRRCHARLERVMPGLGACCVKALLLALMVAPVHAAPPLVLHATSEGRVIARTADGSIAWQVDRTRGGPLAYEVDARGRFLIDGTLLVDRWGRLLARAEGGAPVTAEGSPSFEPDALAWSSPVEISGGGVFQYAAQTPAVFDSAGNAWVILHGGSDAEDTIEVTYSLGRDGNWSAPAVVYSTPEGFGIWPPAAVIDASDRITVAYRLHTNGMDELHALRYTPGIGWSLPQRLAGSDTTGGFQNVYAAVDALGNVVVCFDAQSRSAMYVVVYNAATDTWGEATRISPVAATSVILPTLIQNRAGTSLYAAYLVYGNPGRGLYLRRFRSATLDWAGAAARPGRRLGADTRGQSNALAHPGHGR
jgi:hypothetical protein